MRAVRPYRLHALQVREEPPNATVGRGSLRALPPGNPLEGLHGNAACQEGLNGLAPRPDRPGVVLQQTVESKPGCYRQMRLPGAGSADEDDVFVVG